MNNLEQDAKSALGGGGGGGGNNNMGQDAMKDLSGGGGGGNQQQGGSSGIDKEVNSAVDKVASEEGVPGMADSIINKDVDAEVNKFA